MSDVAIIVIGSIIAYFVIGVLYARSQYMRLWQKRRAINQRDWYGIDKDFKYTNEEAMQCALWRIPGWPYAIFWDLLNGPLRQWFTQPVVERQAYAAQLREEAEAWRKKRHSGTEAEREMAAELYRVCSERAKEVEL